MKTSRGYTYVRRSTIFFSALLSLLGIAIIVYCSLTLVNIQQIPDAVDFPGFYVPHYFLLATGAGILILGIVGLCGSIKESTRLLTSFLVVLIVLFWGLMGIFIFKMAATDSFEENVTKGLRKLIDNYDKSEASKNLMDAVQSSLKCCGVTMGLLDYGLRKLPASCADENYLQPCKYKIFDLYYDNLPIVTGFALGTCFTQVMVITLSLIQCCAIRSPS